MNSDLISYYKERAREYERVYSKPERQEELLLVEKALQETFKNKGVIEIACGTGYWTQKISSVAQSIFATDINESVIELAKSKNYSSATVHFQAIDLYELKETNKHENLFGGFIWSHIPLQELAKFIEHCNSLVKLGGTVVFIDNNYVEGSSTAIEETDSFGNTYQLRKLMDGTSHKVLKNFPTMEFTRQLLSDKWSDLQLKSFEYYWMLEYKIR